MDRDFYIQSFLKSNANQIDDDRRSELEVVLLKKINNRHKIIQNIKNDIKKKHKVFTQAIENKKSICFVGHSQLDQWGITEICGYTIRNCSISGINSFEYNDLIIDKDLLNCETNAFLVMLGTNDLTWDYSIEEIVCSIQKIIKYLRNKNNSAPILFLSCIHINGRLDRDNFRIDDLNRAAKSALSDDIIWIDTSFMDNNNGYLNERYTDDGLHITEVGYDILKTKIESVMKGRGL